MRAIITSRECIVERRRIATSKNLRPHLRARGDAIDGMR